ncbi:uncharacterized protein TRUGW13939_08902 [Talaromyces rugulosus]|uniref:Uncharacterized protein n=1 Tax=Talaromyces rugulosus TaxID=121627 RepID=A0A7H8R6B0_TALRU|nr:uncharacterized protein TRUGW13939_08902 [Talaromyces rugulosus]QKX61746.1 hypothetical protein TRUGW13939_08902 [Talaromyces rugulosus]
MSPSTTIMAPYKINVDMDTSLLQQLNRIDSAILNNEDERVALVHAMRAALSRIETPWESALQIVFTQPSVFAALKTCVDAGLFVQWLQQPLHGEPASASTLARLVDVDEMLLSRLLRHLAATNMLHEEAPGVYRLSRFAHSLGLPEYASMLPFLFETSLPGFSSLPAYLQSNKYANPADAKATNWHYLRGVSRFADLQSRPSEMATFQLMMTTYAANKTSWVDLYPVENEILRCAESTSSSALVVDVGGGRGHDLQRLLHLWQGLLDGNNTARIVAPTPGQLILQDRQATLVNAVGESLIRKMAHDFFQQQPVRGARVYYLHTVLHDWPDREAGVILGQIGLAMQVGYSRLLIHETVVRTDEVQDLSEWKKTTSDMQMMMVLSSAERTEQNWRELIARAGLTVVKIWNSGASAESIIEVVKDK